MVKGAFDALNVEVDIALIASEIVKAIIVSLKGVITIPFIVN